MSQKYLYQGTIALVSQNYSRILSQRFCTTCVSTTSSASILIAARNNHHFNNMKDRCFPQQCVNYSSDADSTESNQSQRNITQERKKANTSLEGTSQYRQNQLKKLNEKFKKDPSTPSSKNSQSMSSWWSSEPLDIDKYEDVQPMWKDMESRVSKRRLPPKLSDVNKNPTARSVNVGRRNIRKTEEEEWLAAGFYDDIEKKK